MLISNDPAARPLLPVISFALHPHEDRLSAYGGLKSDPLIIAVRQSEQLPWSR